MSSRDRAFARDIQKPLRFELSCRVEKGDRQSRRGIYQLKQASVVNFFGLQIEYGIAEHVLVALARRREVSSEGQFRMGKTSPNLFKLNALTVEFQRARGNR